ncbi:MAG: oligosaccharide flippase family protein [Anaerolineae bacterium]|jgi:teichuronic acid exporter
MSEPDKLVRKSLRGALVLAGVTALQFLVGFGSQFVLAWLLLPEHFGALAFAATVADFIKTLMQITGRRYVIKEQSNWQSVVDNAFTLELILGVITVISIGALGLPIMNALGRPEATCFVQILVFAVFTNPFSQLGALYERDLRFGRANIPVAAAVLTEAATSIFLAALGFGTWSLVWGRVARFATMILLYWAVTPYRPRLTFNIPVWREAFAFGAPLTATAVLIFFYWNIDYYIVGRLLNDVQLGYYYLAFQFNAYALKVRSNISAVVFPAFCRAGSDPVIVQGFNLLTRYTAIVFLAISVLILAFGPEIIGVTLGEEWLPSIVPFQILSVATAWRAITSYWDPVLVSKGRTRPFLVAAVLNALIIPTTGYFLTLSHGIIGMAFAVLTAVILTTPIQVIALKRVIKVSYGAILGRPILVALLHLGGSWLIARLIDATTLPGLLLVVGLSLGLWSGMALILIPDLRRDVRRLWRVLRSSLPSSVGS